MSYIFTIYNLLTLQDLNEVQLEPDISKLRNMKRSVLRRRVVDKVKRPEKPVIPTRGTVKLLNFWTLGNIAVISLKLEKRSFTLE